MSVTVLKRCPFCDGPAKSGWYHEFVKFCGCADPDCVAHMLAFDFLTIEDAERAWNTRVPGPKDDTRWRITPGVGEGSYLLLSEDGETMEMEDWDLFLERVRDVQSR